MKLLKLTIHNIASIEDATIDFEQGPLAEDSRFLICGPTGAGKTTLLDAICMALYATTPRLKNAKSEGYVDDTENYSTGSEDIIKIDDARMLMRKGSLDARIELDFTDKDDKPLKSVWACQRAYNKKDGNIKTPTFQLIDGADDTVISAKKTEILRLIEERIGLTFDQFCRTTMLAQGEFTKFLRSEGKNKSQILEKLTGTDVFSEISRQIHVTKVEKSTACERIKNKLQGVQLLSDEEQEQIHTHQKDLLEKIQTLSKEDSELNTQIVWMNQLANLQHELVRNQLALESKNKEMATEDFVRETSLLHDWDNTVVERGLWKEKEAAQQIIRQKIEELEVLKIRYEELVAGLLERRQMIEKTEIRKLKAQEYLAQEEPNEACYRQVALIDTLSTHYLEANRQFTEAQKGIVQTQQVIKDLDLLHRKEDESVKKLNVQLQTRQQELNVLVRQLDTLNYEELLRMQDADSQNVNALKEYRVLIEQEDRLQQSISEKSATIKSVMELVERFTREVSVTTCRLADIEKQRKLQEDVYEKQKMACDNLMQEYRARLTEGDICPLCGQPIVHLATDAHFVSVLQPVQELVTKLQQEQQEATRLLADKKALLVANQRDVQLKQKELEGLVLQEKEINKQITTHALFTHYHPTEKTLSVLEQVIKEKEVNLKELGLKLKEIGGLQAKKSELQKSKEGIEKELHQAENRVKEVERKQSLASDRIATSQQQCQVLKQTLCDTTGRLADYIDMNEFLKDPNGYVSTLKKRASTYQRATDEYDRIEKQLQLLANEMEVILRAKEAIDLHHEDWKDCVSQQPKSIDQLSNCWIDFQTQVSLNGEIRQQAEMTLQQLNNQLASYFKQGDAVTEARLLQLSTCELSQVEQLRRKHQLIGEQVVSLKTLCETTEKNLSKHQENHPSMKDDLTLDEARQLQTTKKEALNEVNQELGKLQQCLDTDKNNRIRFASIHKEFEAASAELQRWERLHDLFGSSEGDKFRNIAQSYVLEQLLVNANSYLRQFTDRYEMECQPGSLTIILRDKEAGGILRPVSTISGGESFLISLSLALGLSSLSRNSISMDTLFIDEGFGTLDSSYLSTVMDALERLHQIGGKRIGIISHVESLKERLTTQIQVTRINNTLSKVEVVSLI